MSGKRPVVCLAAIDWDYLFHRPQQLMLHLARKGHQVHYRNPSQVRGVHSEEAAPNLWVYKDFDYAPKESIESAIYFVYFPAHAAWIDRAGDKFVVYDCLDDLPEFAGHEELMLSRADLVLCCSKILLDKHSGRHPRLVLLPNGVDLAHYAPKGLPAPPEMVEIRSAGEAVIGFVGAFHTGWVDAELLYEVAVARPQWQFVIIGANYEWDFEQGMHKAPPNLRYLGKRSYGILPAYVHSFDIGLIPFEDNAIARAADPIKLYEYLAAGLPVVSRNLPFVQGFAPPMVYPYDDANGCIAAIEQALTKEKEDGEKARRLRLELARSFSWDSRISLLLAKLKELTWLEKGA